MFAWRATHPWWWALFLGVLVVVVGSLLNLWINGHVDAWAAIPGLFTFVGVGLVRSRGWSIGRDWY